jgi:uncharacterized caspase-like protein/endonuclease/exonuclease/phosphatase family metal-dependent hydrolase
MKYALIIGNDQYTDPKLAQLKTPSSDARALAKILRDKKIGGFDEVFPYINKNKETILIKISEFLDKKKPDDLVLIYFSGHGVLDSQSKLFLALKDTRANVLRATAISSNFISDEMDNCRSKRKILILDCCHSGAFGRSGLKSGEQKSVTETTFQGNGFGRVVLTASDATQFALEGDRIDKNINLSLFTHFLVDGLKTGKADANEDGIVSLDEWYDYAYSCILSKTPEQNPLKWIYQQQGDLIIAKNPYYELIKRKAAEKVKLKIAEKTIPGNAINGFTKPKPFYDIDTKTVDGKRITEGVRRLKINLDKAIPNKTADKTLLLATWNIREFGGTKSGGREKEPLCYIAEIISRFDIVAVQEVRDNLNVLNQLIGILGVRWKYLASDIILGAQGNNERHVYIYDTQKISFGGIAGELGGSVVSKSGYGVLKSDFAFEKSRPYIAGFQAGIFNFFLCDQCIFPGDAKGDDPQRIQESSTIVRLLSHRLKSIDSWACNAILLGNLNIFSTEDERFKAIGKEEFKIPAIYKGVYANVNPDASFDQISLIARDGKAQVEIVNAGGFPFFDHVYRDLDRKIYQPNTTDNSYRQWRTFKISDHLPLWVELDIDKKVNDLK